MGKAFFATLRQLSAQVIVLLRSIVLIIAYRDDSLMTEKGKKVHEVVMWPDYTVHHRCE